MMFDAEGRAKNARTKRLALGLALLGVGILALAMLLTLSREPDGRSDRMATQQGQIAADPTDRIVERPEAVSMRTPVDSVDKRPFVVRAMCEGPAGEPLADVDFSLSASVDSGAGIGEGRSGPDGRVTITASIGAKFARHTVPIEVQASCPGWAVLHWQLRYEPGTDVYDLGTLPFGHAGVIVGTVTLDGLPANGALVRVVGPALPAEPGVEARRRVLGSGFPIPRIETRLMKGVRLWTQTDESGVYRLTVPEATYAVITRMRGCNYSCVSPVSVARNAQVWVPPIALERTARQDLIEGDVYDRDGGPLADVQVLCYERGEIRKGAEPLGQTRTGRGGSFAVPCPRGELYTINVVWPARPNHSALRTEVAPGGGRLRIVLPELRRTTVEVVNEEGLVLTPDGLDIVTQGQQQERIAFEEAPAGVVIAAPTQEVQICVEVRGYVMDRPAFLPAGTDASHIRVRMRRQCLIKGSVVASDGEGVAGVRVHAHEKPETLLKFTAGLVTNVSPQVVAITRTAGDGTFELGVRRPGHYVLHAERNGNAAAEDVVLSQDMATPVRLVLGGGGTLEGRVLMPEGQDVEGIIVAATAGDGHVVWQPLGKELRYRFETLAAGDWQLVACYKHCITDFEVGRVFPAPDLLRLPAHASVRAGGVTNHDVRFVAMGLLVGNVELGGLAVGGWSVVCESAGARLSCETDSAGRFRLATWPGRGIVSLTREIGGIQYVVSREVHGSEGATNISIGTKLGAIALQSLRRPMTSEPDHALVFEKNLTGDRWIVTFVPAEDGHFASPAIPLGSATVYERAKEDGPVPTTWRKLGSIDITLEDAASVVRGK